MKLREIIEGIEYRIKNLEDAKECYEKPDTSVAKWIIDDTDSRIDELKTLLSWIKE